MVDYFAANNENAAATEGNAATNGTAQQPATNGEDLEISVSCVRHYPKVLSADRNISVNGS